MSERTHLVHADECTHETTQTPGMTRDQAVRTPSLWAGTATTSGHTFSGWHHHGDYESVIFVQKGRVRLEFGPGGREVLDAAPGDTLYVAPGEIHREGNPDDDASVIIVVRGGRGEIVFNVPGPA